MMKLSFILPVYRDKRAQGAVIRLRALITTQGWNAEIITCGDLTDTPPADSDLHIHRAPASKGGCVRTGVFASTGDTVIILDADIPTSARDLTAVIDASQAAEFVLGCRIFRSSDSRPLLRRCATATYRGILSRVFGIGDFDVQCGLKALQATLAHQLFAYQRISGLAYDLEILLAALDNGVEVAQVPVTWQDQDSTISLTTAVPGMVREVADLYLHRSRIRKRLIHTAHAAPYPPSMSPRLSSPPITEQ
jgi:hypothetical protein